MELSRAPSYQAKKNIDWGDRSDDLTYCVALKSKQELTQTCNSSGLRCKVETAAEILKVR